MQIVISNFINLLEYRKKSTIQRLYFFLDKIRLMVVLIELIASMKLRSFAGNTPLDPSSG